MGNPVPKSHVQKMIEDNQSKIRATEVAVVKNIENISANIAYKLGFNHVPWFTLTKIVLGIYTMLTCSVLFFRTDFVNLTVCTSAIYMILNTDKIKKWTFKCLVLGIFLSLLYDIFWFVMIQDYNSDQTDGGLQKGIRNFSLTVSYFSFFFRIIVALVFWKDSLDFTRIIKQEQDETDPKFGGGGTGSPDKK